ncbi:Phosphorylated carbohydrates phosphatase [Symmachiella macrocystis]|uniref:Phosphorylated carbohydrates phosphatase n=1 Tax=Symmachiella macrocystis TaxID=2527985 RepID=A0A5C6BBE6_9PLAN|nr:HAD family phosphatase [Symmachiella macrocystis]TWU09555.1 Phosphorylated carbohydrates phosphatase [Symmachiella macrocystis]
MTLHQPPIKAVVFDFDGLMFNTEDIFEAAGRELLARRGLEMTPQLLSTMMGRRPMEAFQFMVDMHGLTEPIPDLLEESRVIFSDLIPGMLQPMPGLHELLEHLESRDLPKGVATSSSRSYLEDLLSRHELLERFHVTLTAEDVTHGKPHPEIYLAAAQRLGIHPSEMLVLEDSEAGTNAAASAEAVIVSVPHQHSRSHDFSRAHYVAERLDDPWVLDRLG